MSREPGDDNALNYNFLCARRSTGVGSKLVYSDKHDADGSCQMPRAPRAEVAPRVAPG